MLFLAALIFSMSVDAKPLRVIDEISAKVEFVRGQEKVTESLLNRFRQIAALAKLPIVEEFGAEGYRFAFEVAALDTDLNRGILLSTRRLSQEAAGRLYKEGDAVYAPVALEKKPVSLLFLGYSVDEVQDLLARDRDAYASVSTAKRMPASEVASPDAEDSAFKNAVGMDAGQFAYGLASSFGHCALGVVQGFNALTVDPVVMAGKSMYNLYQKPRWWIAASKQQMIDFAHSLRSFDKLAAAKVSDWKTKTPQEKSQFYCSFYGAGGAGSLLGKGATALATKLPSVAESLGKAAVSSGMKAAAEPKYLAYDAGNIISPNAHYAGKAWYEFPQKGSTHYPYLAERSSLGYLKDMAGKPVPDPAKIDALSYYGRRGAAQALRDYPTGAADKIERALAGPDIDFAGRSLVAVAGDGSAAPRLLAAGDMKPALPTRVNPMRDIRTFVDDGKYQSVSTPGLEYKGNSTIGYKTEAPVLQHRQVRIVIGDRMVEGEYLSAAGPGVPRGADPTRLAGDWGVQGHFVKVGDQTVIVPAEGAEIFVRN